MFPTEELIKELKEIKRKIKEEKVWEEDLLENLVDTLIKYFDKRIVKQ